MHTEKTAPQSASLSSAAQHASGEVVGVTGRGEDMGIAKVHGQRRQRRGPQRDVVVDQVCERKTRGLQTAIRRRRKTLLAPVALEAQRRPTRPQPGFAVVGTGIVSNENFGWLATRTLESAGRFNYAGQKSLE